jgi:hypothetical protein
MQRSDSKFIGRYKVLDELGGGGMGDVYRIWDSATDRELALKKLKFSYPRALHYFKREFRAVSSLSHPNLVSLYDLHNDDDQYYYTMELIEGSDIYEFVNGHNRVITDPDFLTAPGRLERISICMIQLFRGLSFLHRHNRIHRDIKPSNLLVSRKRQLKLVDFGIVKELLPGGQGHSLSQVFGTSTYFSPEQSLGSDVTHASDNYSAGVVLYEMLAGVPPFLGESADVALKHRSDAPPSLAQRVPGAPPELVLLCMKLLQKRPEDRPSAQEALGELDPDYEHGTMTMGEFIGRAEPRKSLHECLERVRADQGQAVLIVGESGLGKTALLEEFARESSLFGADFFSGTCTMRDHVRLRGLDTVIERMAEAYRKETARALRRLTEAERGLLLDRFIFLKELLPADEHGVVLADGSTGVALSKLFDQLAKRRTLVVVIEQIELADDTLLDTMEDVFSGSFIPPVLFIFTLNPRFIIKHSKVAAFLNMLGRSSSCDTIELKPFGLEETIQFIEEHSYPAPRFLAEYIHDESRGVPSYVGLLTQQISRFRGSVLPPLKETVRIQIDGFSPAVKLMLSTISVADEALSMRVLKTACNLDGETAFAAVQELRFLNYVELLTTDAGHNHIVATEANALELVRNTLSPKQLKSVNEALATAHEKHRGHIDAIIKHWTAASQAHRAVEYAWLAADQAEGDGDHGRAGHLLRVCLSNASDDAAQARVLRRLADSLGRQGQYQEAWQALEELRVLAPEEDIRVRAKCCQYALLCGDLDGFEDNFIKLPRAARPALASLLTPYLPDRTLEFIEQDESWESMLAKGATALHDLNDKSIRDGQVILDALGQDIESREPELKVSYAIVRGKFYAIQGNFSEARLAFAAVETQDFDRIIEQHRFKPDYQLAHSEVLYKCGDYLAARSLARSVERYARKFGRLGLATRSGLLLAHLDFACEDSLKTDHSKRLRSEWHPRTYSIVDAHIDLLEIWQAFHSHQLDEAQQAFDALTNRVHFANALSNRSVHCAFYGLKARMAIYIMLTQSKLPERFDVNSLFTQLHKHSGAARDLVGVVRLAILYSEKKWTEVENVQLQKQHRAQDPLPEALALAIRGAAMERTQKGGMRAWQASLHCLKNAGLALPPEIHHFRANFERPAVRGITT